MKNVRFITALIITLTISTTALATQGVSPGATDRMAVVEQRCPTFSWVESEDAEQYEVIAYVLPEDPAEQVELTAGTEVLYAAVPAGATSWTPSAEQCVAPGGRYVWFVRAATETAGDQVIDSGEWSEGRYFQVPAGPSDEEVARAVEVLERWEAANGHGSLPLSSVAVPVAGAATDSQSGSSHPKSVPTASAAIRGEHPAMTGEVYGLVGTSASPQGAGVAAANLHGGADLVLDGSRDGQVDTLLSQAGIDRPSAADETFVMDNTGAGRMHLEVRGDLSADALSVEEVAVSGMTVIDDAREWLGAGSTVPCPGCVTSSDIADGEVGNADLAGGSVTADKIHDFEVGSLQLAAGAVTSSRIQDGAVTSVKLAPGAVTSTRLAPSSVSSDHIVDGIIATEDLHNLSVTEAKLASDSVTTGKIAADAVTGNKIAIDAVSVRNIVDGHVTTDKLADAAVTAAKLADFSVTANQMTAESVNSAAIINGSITADDLADSSGIYLNGTPGDGVYVESPGDHGVEVRNSVDDGVYVTNSGDNGVHVNNAGGNGVYGESSSASDYGGFFLNDATDGGALYARADSSNAPDLVLGGNFNDGDDGTIFSQPDMSTSDIVVYSNDNVHFHLDEDGDSSSGFTIYDGSNTALWTMTEGGTEVAAGNSAVLVDAGRGAPAMVYAVHSPQSWLEDFGSGSLKGSGGSVILDPAFTAAANLGELYHVFLTPLGDCALFVKEKRADGFSVGAVGGQQCDAGFDYRVVALRRGYESMRMEEFVEIRDD